MTNKLKSRKLYLYKTQNSKTIHEFKAKVCNWKPTGSKTFIQVSEGERSITEPWIIDATCLFFCSSLFILHWHFLILHERIALSLVGFYITWNNTLLVFGEVKRTLDIFNICVSALPCINLVFTYMFWERLKKVILLPKAILETLSSLIG